jgi:membrane protein YdbS with pleckstrin-like domain
LAIATERKGGDREDAAMRCPQCGNNTVADAAFCSRCGARLYEPKPADKREYALVRVMPSWWHFTGALIFSGTLIVAGFAARFAHFGDWRVGVLLIAAGIARLAMAGLQRHSISWSLTSERLIERTGLFSNRRRELELADIRSVEINRRFAQRLFGVGTVTVASAASADFKIRLEDIGDPDGVAETLRRARIKRLA